MAKRTRMSAIKRLSNRLAQRGALRIVNDHRRPRQRLESDPMQTNRAAKRENRGDAAGAAKHEREASDALNQSQSMVETFRCDVWAPQRAVSTFWNKNAIAFIEIFG